MSGKRKPTDLTLSAEALFRYQVVSLVLAKRQGGMTLAQAIRETAALRHRTPDGDFCDVSGRSLYRWVHEADTKGLSGLETKPRSRLPTLSGVLSQALLEFIRAEKALDRHASVPELLRRARHRGVLTPDEQVDRTTVWRACRRMALPLRRLPGKHEADMRRFAYPHRMMMVLADGKHFRAGPRRSRRVAFFFLDDATRYALGVIVCTAEAPEPFLRGLYRVICHHGLMGTLYLDSGPGFIADDTARVTIKLDIRIVLGTAGYPEGHGKIERFNQSAGADVLRGLVAPHIDDDCGALELRLQHYLDHQYNQRPHEGLDGQTPLERWAADTAALRFPKDEAALRDRFVVTETRRVTKDHTLSFDGTDYEVPRGHGGETITVYRRVLGGQILVPHDGRLVTLHPVDLARNAADRRARPAAQTPAPDDDESCPTTAAELAFQRDLGPVVGPDGGFRPPKKGI
jgi:transposase InsO family protein